MGGSSRAFFDAESKEDIEAHYALCLQLSNVLKMDITQEVASIRKDRARKRLKEVGKRLGREQEMEKLIRNVEEREGREDNLAYYFI